MNARIWPEQPNSVDRAESVYESYRDNRDMGIRMDRLRDVFGDIEEMEARYRSEQQPGEVYYLIVDNLTGGVRRGSRVREGAPSGCRAVKVREVE